VNQLFFNGLSHPSLQRIDTKLLKAITLFDKKLSASIPRKIIVTNIETNLENVYVRYVKVQELEFM
jgi:hypothetical protein